MQSDLRVIKKLYGEPFMHMCKKLFPTLLETDGLLSKILMDNFNPCIYLFKDLVEQNKIIEFKDYIYSKIDLHTNKIKSDKTPFELMDEAGYELFECKTEEDIQSFKRYYAKGEELCTFDQNKINSYYVFFAVLKNVDQIKREDFIKPDRQDKYGTSVISIQFTRGINNTLSIKNRYNHKVKNPDATFSNNLENIIEGLTSSFEKHYNLRINEITKSKLELDNYVLGPDGIYYKYNYKINNNYYCNNNIIVTEFNVIKYPSEKYVIMDYFILDLVNKKITLKDNNIKDSFIDEFNDILKIEVKKEIDGKNIYIYKENNIIIVKIDSKSRIVSYYNEKVDEIGDNFLSRNNCLEKFYAPNVHSIGDCFCLHNTSLTEFYCPNLEYAGNNVLYYNDSLESIDLSNTKKVGHSFLKNNTKIEIVDLSSLEEHGEYFFEKNSNVNSKRLIKVL